MKQTKTVALIVTALTIGTAVVADAGPVGDGLATRNARIRQGVVSGTLTPGEAHALKHEQQVISHLRARALADGHIGVREARSLDAALDKASSHIYRLKHN